MKYVLIAFAVLVSGCAKEPEKSDIVLDQCMRVELFQQCMKLLPAGPLSTQYNDWDEVVTQCDSVAMYQSKRPAGFVKKECMWK